MFFKKQKRQHMLQFFSWSALSLLLIVIAWSFYCYFARQCCETAVVQLGGEKTIACQGTWVHSFAMETPLSERAFMELAREKQWKARPIQKPFKIARYTIAKSKSEGNVCIQVIDGLPENEAINSYYHFIKKGYYYMDESSGYTIHAAYDSDSQKYYYYRKVHGPGFRQEEMNPSWTN